MFPVPPSPRDRLMLMKLSKGVGVGQAHLVWLGERAVTAVQPILVRRAQVVFSRPFQGHLELYREMLQVVISSMLRPAGRKRKEICSLS